MGAAEMVHVSAPQSSPAVRVERVFNDCFADSCNTRLCGGADEPLYQPATTSTDFHALYYRGDYFASALHEVAHWCIAGAQRRQRLDFGYWYTPQDRSIDQQCAFEAVECKPQALEWYFSRACGYRFQVSADNLALANAGLLDTAAFQHAVLAQTIAWKTEGLPIRAGIFYIALRREFGTDLPAVQLDFTLADLV